MRQRAGRRGQNMKSSTEKEKGWRLARFTQKMRGADFDDEIRSLVKPPSGFAGQHLLITPDKQK